MTTGRLLLLVRKSYGGDSSAGAWHWSGCTSPAAPSRRAMRRAVVAPSADTGAGLATSVCDVLPDTSTCKRSTRNLHPLPSMRLTRRRHSPAPREAASCAGNVAASMSHARKSLSGSRNRRQQHWPRRSTNDRHSCNPSLLEDVVDSARTACIQPASSLPRRDRYRHSTVPSPASCDGRGNSGAPGVPAIAGMPRVSLVMATRSQPRGPIAGHRADRDETDHRCRFAREGRWTGRLASDEPKLAARWTRMPGRNRGTRIRAATTCRPGITWSGSACRCWYGAGDTACRRGGSGSPDVP